MAKFPDPITRTSLKWDLNLVSKHLLFNFSYHPRSIYLLGVYISSYTPFFINLKPRHFFPSISIELNTFMNEFETSITATGEPFSISLREIRPSLREHQNYFTVP